MRANIILKKETSVPLAEDHSSPYHGFNLKVSVERSEGVPSKIFVMQRDVDSRYSAGQLDRFYSVASIGEMAWIPEDSTYPSPEHKNFFRTDSIEIHFETLDEMEAAWVKINSEVAALQRAALHFYSGDIESFVTYGDPSVFMMYGYGSESTETAESNFLSMARSDVVMPISISNLSSSIVGSRVYVVFPEEFFTDGVSIFKNGVDITAGSSSVSIDVNGNAMPFTYSFSSVEDFSTIDIVVAKKTEPHEP